MARRWAKMVPTDWAMHEPTLGPCARAGGDASGGFMPGRDSKGALHRDIYERLRASIIEGRLKPGARVPSARALATQLTLSRGTVDLAYAILAGEGYIVARGARGTFVSSALPERTSRAPLQARPVAPAAVRRAPFVPAILRRAAGDRPVSAQDLVTPADARGAWPLDRGFLLPEPRRRAAAEAGAGQLS